MKTREQWVEEVMEQIDDYKYIESVAQRVNAKKALRALLLEVPEPEGWKLVKSRTIAEVSAEGEKISGFYADDDRAGIDIDVSNAFYAGVRFVLSPEYKDEEK